MHRTRAAVFPGIVAVSIGIVSPVGCSLDLENAVGAGRRWKLIPQNHIDAIVLRIGDDADMDAPVMVSFDKTTEERRLLPLEISADDNLPDARALELRYYLNLWHGQAPRLAVVLFEKQSGVWFKRDGQPLVTGWPELSDCVTEELLESETDWEPTLADMVRRVRLPLRRFNQAAFSQDADGELRRDQVTKAWIGLVLDGSVRGALMIFDAKFTSEPYRPTRPFRVTDDGPGAWTVAKDPAVRAKLTTPKEGLGGKACMKFDYTFPADRHMYALPTLRLPEAEYEGYRALRFTYKATLPKGIGKLLVSLSELDGSQYCVEPTPPACKEVWRTVTLPFEAFKLGGWSRDENGRLDLDQLGSLTIGLHGTARGAKGSGVILAADVELVP